MNIVFNAFCVDGYYANKVAQDYLDAVICNSVDNETGKINVNSWKKDWSISSSSGVSKVSKLSVSGDKLVTR